MSTPPPVAAAQRHASEYLHAARRSLERAEEDHDAAQEALRETERRLGLARIEVEAAKVTLQALSEATT